MLAHGGVAFRSGGGAMVMRSERMALGGGGVFLGCQRMMMRGVGMSPGFGGNVSQVSVTHLRMRRFLHRFMFFGMHGMFLLSTK